MNVYSFDVNKSIDFDYVYQRFLELTTDFPEDEKIDMYWNGEKLYVYSEIEFSDTYKANMQQAINEAPEIALEEDNIDFL